MTREEAIEIIQKLIGRFKSDSRTYKALEMAIQALSQEPCDDAIDRAEAMTEIMMSKSITAFDRDLWIRTKDAVHILRELPSVTQKSVLEQIRAEIDGIDINGQVDEHTMFIRSGEQVKQMALDIIDHYTK